MMRFSELMKAIEGRVRVGEVRAGRDPEVLRVCEDSRKVREGDLFVVRKGTKRDGAEFVADAILKGAVGVVVESGQLSVVSGQLGEVASAEVGDVNLALALLAHEVGGRPTAGMKVIGVTGTKGKTTVAYLMRSVLGAAGKRVGMVGTVEIDDGERVVAAEMTTPGVVELVELFGRMKGNGVEYVVMEVSSHSLHQHRVGGIDFAVGVFTNLTGDHLDYHGTMEEYAAAKGMLFEGLGKDAFAIINGDDAWAERMVRGCKGRVVQFKVTDKPLTKGAVPPMEVPGLPGDAGAPTPQWTYPGEIPPGGFATYIWRMNSNGMGLTVAWDHPPFEMYGLGHTFVTPLVGRHNAYNITAAYVACGALGALRTPADLEGRVRMAGIWKKAAGAPGRLQRVDGKGAKFNVFVDYAHTHDSLENVLKAVRGTMGKGRLICVFGCGGDRDRTKRPKMGAVAEGLADRVIVTSDNPRTEDAGGILREICAGFSTGWERGGKISVVADRRGAIRAAIGMAEAGDVVLIAGKGHENYQIVGTVKHHFDDVEEAEAALRERFEIRKQK
ncbi:MAG: Mur ligase family protein [Phycisphaerae bacterium]